MRVAMHLGLKCARERNLSPLWTGRDSPNQRNDWLLDGALIGCAGARPKHEKSGGPHLDNAESIGVVCARGPDC
jgi:hypothetical protein